MPRPRISPFIPGEASGCHAQARPRLKVVVVGDATRIQASKNDSVRDLALRIVDALAERGEVEVAAPLDLACLLADAVNEAREILEGRVEQVGGRIYREKRRGRARTLVAVRLRLRP